ncbi:50S ribosomal protein P1 [Thermocladium modestius]|uniref:Large ribosomal subunit protein P1 n=1 Tax=Thermocladium modestius TaxID=62609 RepID=A0A830GTZ3_9CREN|nr:50S ribosomal protein P1 [Thermocladium modestius]GGP19408.1 50S ribosomal protein P1 [Thermocladium modestius]
MEYVYATLLLHYAKQPINEENIAKVLQAAGVSADEIKVKALVAAIKDVNIDEAIKTAAFAPAPAAAAPAAQPQAAAAAAAPAGAEKKEEKKEEKSEEETIGGLASLFG